MWEVGLIENFRTLLSWLFTWLILSALELHDGEPQQHTTLFVVVLSTLGPISSSHIESLAW